MLDVALPPYRDTRGKGVSTARKGFELEAMDLSGAGRLLSRELRVIALELGIPGAKRLGPTALMTEIERIDPERFEKG
jgi:hypothetical protein